MSNIQNMSLEDIMGERLMPLQIHYSRKGPFPDTRDGLKPVQRRILRI